jgi:hypothetical protein
MSLFQGGIFSWAAVPRRRDARRAKFCAKKQTPLLSCTVCKHNATADDRRPRAASAGLVRRSRHRPASVRSEFPLGTANLTAHRIWQYQIDARLCAGCTKLAGPGERPVHVPSSSPASSGGQDVRPTVSAGRVLPCSRVRCAEHRGPSRRAASPCHVPNRCYTFAQRRSITLEKEE